MGLSFATTPTGARCWIASALLVSTAFAACAPDAHEDTGRSMHPSTLGPLSSLDAAVGGPALPPGAGGGTLGGAAWPIANDAGLGLLPDASGPDNAAAARPCNRDVMQVMVDRFFLALKAHDTSSLPFAPNVKFTENGRQLQLGEGIWKTAGAEAFKHSAYDAETCNTVTEAVIAEGTQDIPLGVRLKFEPPAEGTAPSQAQQILEIEVIAARPGSYVTPSDPSALAESATEMWEQLIPASQRATRAQLEKIVDDYFVQYPAGACYFAPHCLRFENGLSSGACSQGMSCAAGTGQGGLPRLKVVDPEAGIAVGFVMFANAYTNFHMFRVRGGQVQALHAILASASSPGW